MVTITERDSDTGPATKIVDYSYDATNRRIAKSIDTDGDGTADEESFYIYDGERTARDNAGDHIVLEFDASGDLTHRYLHGPAVDQILADEALDHSGTPSSDTLWPLADNLGTIRDLATYEPSTTTIVNHLVYGAFGQVAAQTDATVKHAFGFTAREIDPESDLFYYRARYYDAVLAQWVGEDPLGFEAGDANLRRYVGNHVTYSVDPSGLDELHDALLRMGAVFRNENAEIVNRARKEIQAELRYRYEALASLDRDLLTQDAYYHLGLMDRQINQWGERNSWLADEFKAVEIYRYPRKITERDSSGNYTRRVPDITERMEKFIPVAKLWSMAQQNILPQVVKRNELRRFIRVHDLGERPSHVRAATPLELAAATTRNLAASFVPLEGELQDKAVIEDPDAPMWQKGLAVVSIGASALTITAMPNIGGFLRGDNLLRVSNDLVAPTAGERVFRTMSANELAQVQEAGGLVIRKSGSHELGITLNASYLDDLMSRPELAKMYEAAVEIEVAPGTWNSLIGQAAAHPSAAELFPNLPVFKKGMTVPQVKLEKNGVVSILLGSSEDAVQQFNSSIIRIKPITNVD